jgi:hypothetical protein
MYAPDGAGLSEQLTALNMLPAKNSAVNSARGEGRARRDDDPVD